MNIFYTDFQPKVCAVNLDDIRGRKMILESAQLLSTTIRYLDPTTTLPVYRVSHLNHPCAVWVRQGQINYAWLWQHMFHLAQVHCPHHKSAELLDVFEDWFGANKHLFPTDSGTPIPNCTIFKDEPRTIQAYRRYMNHKWKHDKIKVTWNNGRRPDWYEL